MPVIVDEVVISVEVGNRDAAPAAATMPVEDRQVLVEECVARVLDILRERAEP